MFRAHAAVQPRPGQIRFEVHRSALAEASADAAMGMAWILLWLVFVLALAQPAPARGGQPGPIDAPAACVVTDPGSLACQGKAGTPAQPVPGPSSRGVASHDPAGAG
jgi:hypothetical protein